MVARASLSSSPRRRGSRMVALSRCRSCSLREAASGCAPDRAVPFLCFAKEKEPKERRPCSPVGLGPTALRCSVMGVRGRNSLRGLWPLRSNICPKSEDEARSRAPPPSPALLDGSPRGPRAMPRLRHRVTPRFASARSSRCASEARGEELAAGVRHVHSMALTGRSLQLKPYSQMESAFALVTFIWRDK